MAVNAADIPNPTSNPFDSLHSTVVTNSRDWSSNKADAWIYGIVVGWSKETRLELAEKYGWNEADLTRLKQLHKTFKKAHQAHG